MARKAKAETFFRYDTADYLKSEEDALAYIEAAMEEAGDDASFIAVALGNVARARGMMQLAKETGLTREGLYKALSAEGNPSLATTLKVMKALGMKLAPQRAAAAAATRRAKRHSTRRTG
jgi:probable addiction module antidote protein